MKKLVKGIEVTGLLGIIWAVTLYLYKGFLIMPNIKCTIDDEVNTINFSVTEEFRSITIKLHPQIVVQFDNYVLLLIYMDDYFQNEYIYFDEENKGHALIKRDDYANKLKHYMKDEIIRLVCAQDSKISPYEMSERLKIYISILGGVRYETKEGNEEKRFCIIIQDGIMKEYEEHDDEIMNRLNETTLVMRDNVIEIDRDMEIEIIILEMVKQINLLY